MSGSQIWIPIAVAGAILFAAALILFLARSRPRYGDLPHEAAAELRAMPSTSLQRRARWSLLIGAVALAALILIFASSGVTAFFERQSIRLLVLALFAATVGVHVSLLSLAKPASGGEPSLLDERDLSILSRAPRMQSAAVLLTLMVWVIGLQETYWDQGSIPLVFPLLIFLSTFIVQMLAMAAGILLGYWRAQHHAQG